MISYLAAAELGVPLDDVIEALEMRGAVSPASLDALPGEDEEGAPLSAFLGVDEAGYADFERRDLLRRALDALSEDQRELIRQRFFEGKSQREIAEGRGVSQMWVSRAERRAIEQLRAAAGEQKKT